MKKTLLIILSLIASSSSQANQFESLIDVISPPSNVAYTNNDWSAIEKAKGIKWKWKYSQSGAHGNDNWNNVMEGTTKVGVDKNPNIGKTSVKVYGQRFGISQIVFVVQNETVDIKFLGEGKMTKIKTNCDDESLLNTYSIHKFEKSEYKPIYVLLESSYGASGAGSTAMSLFMNVSDALSNNKSSCKKLG